MGERLPDIARKGKIISFSNATEAIRNAAENNPDDKYREFRAKWNPIIDEIKRRFYPDFWTPHDQFEMPKPPLAIEDMRNLRTLASYRIVPDGYGLNDKFTLNEAWMVEKDGRFTWFWGDQEFIETATHEIGHERMQYLVKLGKMKPMSNPHGKPFTTLMENLGIYCNSKGQHEKPADDPNKPVGVLLKDLGIPMLRGVDLTGMPKGINYWDFLNPGDGISGKKKGRSTLTLWVCECTPPQRARIGTDVYYAHCDICNMPFRRK